jgi:UDP-2-acetamido-2-deoxy-ribo-hexuluronate aminotransferase
MSAGIVLNPNPLNDNFMEFVDLKLQQKKIKKELDKRISTVLSHGKYIMGPEVFELEEKLQKYTGSRYCITVSSGTDALLISLMSLNVGPGDEVITSSFSFISTIEVIVRLGAKPVLVDIDRNTCNIDTSKIESEITKKTKAIMPVSLYGQPSNMDEINKISARYGNIPVIEDAAQSFGSTYKGNKSCNLSTIGCTSFFPSKPLGCYGDGGAIFTNDSAIAQACKEIRIHGQSRRYMHTRIGIGGRMDTLQCAIILAKFNNFDWEVKQRRIIGDRYNKLMDHYGIERVKQYTDCVSVFGQYSIFVNNRDKLQEKFKSINIPFSVHYPLPLNKQPAYKNILNSDDDFPVANAVSKEIISIPMHPYLTEQEQINIVQIV